MGSSCPLQNDQPLGGKFQLMILISPRNGSDIVTSSFNLRPVVGRACWVSDLFKRSQPRTAVLHSSCKEPYVWDGKIPNNDKIKLITRNGIMLSCGCEPPADPIAAGSI